VFFTSPILATGPYLFANQYADSALAGLHPIKVFFHQHTRLSPDAPQGPDLNELIVQCRTLGVDCVLTTDHNPGLVGDFPDFVATWDATPSPAPVAEGQAAGDGAPADGLAGPLAGLSNPLRSGELIEIASLGSGPGSGAVGIRLANAGGQVVREGSWTHHRGGRLDTTGLAPGVYFLELQVGEARWSRRLILLR
jgi:hypothetical protein